MEFGKYLKQLRRAKGMTLKEIEAISGLSHSYISQIENGKRGAGSANADTIRKLANALGVTHIGMMIKAGHITEEEVLTYRSERGVSP